MKCPKCGAEIPNDSKFCAFCGSSVEMPPTQTEPPAEEMKGNQKEESTKGMADGPIKMPKNDPVEKEAKKRIPHIPPIEPENASQKQAETLKTKIDEIKREAVLRWRTLSTFGKIATVAIAAFLLLFIAALLSGKAIVVAIAIFQIALAVVALLMHERTIKLPQKQLWLKWLVLAVAVLLTVLNIESYSWNDRDRDDLTHAAVVSVTAPYGADECIGQDYFNIWDTFISAGFTNVNLKEIEDLNISVEDKLNTIDSISIAGETTFSEGQDFKSNDQVTICYHAYKKCNLTIHVECVPNLIFSKYDVNLLLNEVEEGVLPHGETRDFELSVEPGEYTLTFESDESSSVKGEIMLKVDCDLEVAYKISCHSDKVAIEMLYVDKGAGDEDISTERIEKDGFNEKSNTLVTVGQFCFSIPNYWNADVEEDDVYMAYAETSDKVSMLRIISIFDDEDAATFDLLKQETEDGLMAESIASWFDECGEVQSTLFDNGNIKGFIYSTDFTTDGHDGKAKVLVFPSEADNNWLFVSLSETNDTEYTYFDDFSKMLESISASPTTSTTGDSTPKSSKAVYYSTNTKDTVKNGNSGIYSYKSIGGTYDIYWVIDFDEGYVYFFTDGDGNEICDRVKIDSGDLNSGVIITYHDGDSTWQEALHFKWANQPDHLVAVDADCFDYDYYTTDLTDALAIRDSRRIVDY